MVLEFKVWGSREWYEKAVPMLEEAGLTSIEELRWADPNTDGELMGLYYDYAEKDPLDAATLADLLARVRKVVIEGEAPSIEIGFVASPKASPATS